MMQRKNKRPSRGEGYGSGYESNDNNGNTASSLLESSPSKPPAPPHEGGISISALTGHGTNRPPPIERKASKGAKGGHTRKASKVTVASVKRNNCGTQPFDRHWLNLDCCGLICAGLTYCLHVYGVYAFGWILLPPWFSVMDEDGYRELSFGCHFHRTVFIAIAFLAVFAHFKAMTTDPGAVPPDANPLPDLEELGRTSKGEDLDELNDFIKGESSPRHSPNRQQQQQQQHTSSLMQESSSSLMQEDRSLLDNNGGSNGMNNGHGHGLPQAVAAAGAVGAAVVGGAAAVGAAAMEAAASAGAAPIKPRSVPPSQQPRGRRMCRRCQAFKPPRAHHCSICKRCIIKMDHHCPWVNNCVGIGNHKYFLLFIFYTSLSCAYSFLFIIYRFFHCIGHSHNHLGPRCVDHPTDLLPLVGLTVEALLFGLFTLCMMVDQWDVVMTNLTHIDRLKGETHHHGYHGQQHQGYGQLPQHMTPHYNPQHAASLMKRAGIHEVFGTGRSAMSRFHYSWLSPLHKVCFPETVRDDIFGYCRPCSGATSQQESRRSVQGMEMVGRGGAISAEEIV